MAIPSVAVDLRRGRVFVIATYSPGPGTYVNKTPVLESSSSDVEAIGRNVLQGLGEFVDGGEMPDWNVYRSPVLEFAKLTTWREYEKGLKRCVVDQELENLVVRGDNPTVTIAHVVPVGEIGNAVLRVLGTTKERELKKSEPPK